MRVYCAREQKEARESKKSNFYLRISSYAQSLYFYSSDKFK